MCLTNLAAYEDSNLSPEEVQELAKAKPMEDRVERIIIYKNEILVCCTSGAKFSIGSVGKAVFLSREEAEKTLEVGKP